MTRLALPLITVGLIAALGCNGGNNGPDTVTTTTSSIAGPSSAKISAEVVDFGLLSSSGSGALFGLQIRLTESAGVGAHINFFRLDVYRATGEVEESSEVGASDIVAGIGNNRLEPNSTWENVVIFFFRATIKKGRQLVVTVNLTDDKGNRHELTATFVFN